MNAKTRTTFDTNSTERYKFTHGHHPRGQGLWMFDLGRSGAWTTTQYHGSYTEAKAQAMREARQLGCDTVCVCT